MTNTIQLKRSSVADKQPTTDLGEVGINTNDGKLYIKKDDGSTSIIEVGRKIIQKVASNANVSDNDFIVCSTAGAALATNTTAYTLTLPASPIDKSEIRFMDADNNAQERPILIAGNGNTIDVLSEDLICDVNYFDVTLVYDLSSTNWQVGGK